MVDKKPIDKPEEFLKLFSSSKFDIGSYHIEFSKNDLLRNKKYSKLTNQEKLKIDNIFSSSIHNAELTCNNCGFKEDIVETIKLYEYNISDKVNNVRSLDDNKLLTKNPLLPRSRDYVCKNLDCPTNDPKKKGINKEVVWIRTPKNFNIEHICTICYHSWN